MKNSFHMEFGKGAGIGFFFEFVGRNLYKSPQSDTSNGTSWENYMRIKLTINHENKAWQ